MQVLRALQGKHPGDVGRFLCEDGFLLIVALPEPDALSAPQINCRPDLHRKSFRKDRRIRGQKDKRETQNMAHAPATCKYPNAHQKRATPSAAGASAVCHCLQYSLP